MPNQRERHPSRRARAFILGITLLILGVLLLAGSLFRFLRIPIDSVDLERIGLTMSWVLIVLGIIVIATAVSTRNVSTSIFRLDCFLPAIRKTSRQDVASVGAAYRIAHRLLPAFFFSNRQTKKRGFVREVFRRVGISWLSAPFRRITQAVCFAAFCLLFFVVCWPYAAEPEEAGKISTDWKFLELSETDGLLSFQNDDPPAWIRPAQHIFVVDQSQSGDSEAYFAHFVVHQINSDNISVGSLDSQDGLSDQAIVHLLTSTGPWAIHEKQPERWPTHYADHLTDRELIPADLFLAIDPLVSISTAIAARSWVWSLASAFMILIVCILIPRGFCGYLCPLGTLIDLFDWSIGKRVKRFRVADDGWWVHIKYYLLLGTLLCSVFGVLVSGYVAAIPVITRGLLFVGEPIQSGIMRGWHLVPAVGADHYLSIGMFFVVLSLGFLQPRFWCKYVCPSGATFSIANLLRVSERKVESSCIHCNKCVEVCPFDAIKPDFTTRETDCTLCQTCGGVCPTHAIKFVERWNEVELKVLNDPPTGETTIGRRGFLSLATGVATGIAGAAGFSLATKSFGAQLGRSNALAPVRPPGSVPEQEFLQMCIRCGECFKVCPNNVLQPQGFQQGLEGLWTPIVNADWAGCESSCNTCGQVCPTGAIRALSMPEKKVARMGLAIVNEKTCLPFAGREACQLCVDECVAAGYDAIEFTRVLTEADEEGQPIEGSGFLAPVVIADKCVGCGLCQTRCYSINKKEKGVLDASAIVIEAGEGKEDRMMDGSYVELREREKGQGTGAQKPAEPERDPTPTSEADTPNDPFGIDTSEPVIEFENAIQGDEPSIDTDDPFGIE